MQNVEWVMGEWVIPLRLLRLLEHLAVLKRVILTVLSFFVFVLKAAPKSTKNLGMVGARPPFIPNSNPLTFGQLNHYKQYGQHCTKAEGKIYNGGRIQEWKQFECSSAKGVGGRAPSCTKPIIHSKTMPCSCPAVLFKYQNIIFEQSSVQLVQTPI